MRKRFLAVIISCAMLLSAVGTTTSANAADVGALETAADTRSSAERRL